LFQLAYAKNSIDVVEVNSLLEIYINALAITTMWPRRKVAVDRWKMDA